MDRLLTVQNAKTRKGEKLGILTGILYLAPANESGLMNTCASSTPECRHACLYTAGRVRFDSVRHRRIRKTIWLAAARTGFVKELKRNVTRLVARAHRLGLKPTVRINGTSDLPWLAQELAAAFPEVQFYDYTKQPKPWLRTLPNYHLTFSHSGHNFEDCLEALQHGINVAVVLATGRGDALPETWNGFAVTIRNTADSVQGPDFWPMILVIPDILYDTSLSRRNRNLYQEVRSSRSLASRSRR